MQKKTETSIFTVKGDSLPGLLIIGTFEKRAPGPLCSVEIILLPKTCCEQLFGPDHLV